ncbi:hypothetical protein [Candidatus Mycobacterium methanotrophicum]|uniref:DUF4175 domain-containing protein n=1 Tax=Candidatus Mycobacterium methanotrophicum TaxID=2943498 RepID=A0ABY4QQM0_9MYCO|nr:hypothetical protein [Candidatus Mycobacterium methanotrophicum]UQX13377.1 hypothetical protein M5I08_00830 [Candidatus Mycobacterium methanotrophicum]
MVILGIVLLVVGYVLPLPVLITVGWILVVVGAVLWILGAVAGRWPADDTGSDVQRTSLGCSRPAHRIGTAAPHRAGHTLKL